jgi:hypothetical protein
MGFKLNPYDLCVANSQIKGKQCTVAWYVDDNKISHVDDMVVTNSIEKIEAKFGKMTVTRGKCHVFLGMDITFNDDDGTVTILMKEYLKASPILAWMLSRLRQRRQRKTCSPLTTDPSNLTNFSQHCRKITLRFQKSSYRRSIGYCFPLHQGLVQYGAGLEKVDPTPPIFQRYFGHASHSRS